jgi:lysophospholipase L1-like esterase
VLTALEAMDAGQQSDSRTAIDAVSGDGTGVTDAEAFRQVIDAAGIDGSDIQPGAFRRALSVNAVVVPVDEPTHASAITYAAAVATAGGAVTTAALNRISRAFALLETAGLLDDLVDGAYYGTDGNTTSGSPISLLGTTAHAAPGSWTRDAYGAVFTQSDAQVIAHAIADTPAGTFAIDYSSDGSAISFGTVAYACPAARGDVSAAMQVAQSSSSRLQLWCKNASVLTQTGQMAEGVTARFIWSRNKDRNRLVTTYGAASTKQWVNGINSTTSPSANEYTDVTAIDRLVIGGALGGTSTTWQGLFKGRISSWLLFGRALTEPEARVADRAMQCLDSRSRVFVAEGDSTVAALTDSSIAQDHWPAKLAALSGWEVVRFANLASNGQAAQNYVGQIDTQARPTVPRDFAPIGYYSASGDINGIASAGKTAAQSYADILAALDAAAALGFRTVALTMAVPDWSVIYPAFFAIANDLNTLIRAGYAAGDFDFLIDVDLLVPNHTGGNAAYWRDGTHLNGAGNALVAAEIASVIGTP